LPPNLTMTARKTIRAYTGHRLHTAGSTAR